MMNWVIEKVYIKMPYITSALWLNIGYNLYKGPKLQKSLYILIKRLICNRFSRKLEFFINI
jgi:hypothetical protein